MEKHVAMQSLVALATAPLRFKSILYDLDELDDEDFSVDFLVDELSTVSRMAGHGLPQFAKQLTTGKYVDETCVALEDYCARLVELLGLLSTMSRRTRRTNPSLSGLQTQAQKSLAGAKPSTLPAELVKCFNWKKGQWATLGSSTTAPVKKAKGKPQLAFAEISREHNNQGVKKVSSIQFTRHRWSRSKPTTHRPRRRGSVSARLRASLISTSTTFSTKTMRTRRTTRRNRTDHRSGKCSWNWNPLLPSLSTTSFNRRVILIKVETLSSNMSAARFTFIRARR